MNCDCISKIEAKMKETFTNDKRFKKPIKNVSVESAMIFGKQLSQRTYSNIEIELEGQKKPVAQKMMHSFCPFCGTEIKTEEKETVVAQNTL